MEIIQPRGTVENTYYTIEVDRIGEPGCGFSFDCDQHGNVKDGKRRHQISKLKEKSNLYHYRGVVAHKTRWTQHAIGRCACGEAVELSAFTNTCSQCGRDYNMSGQELAPRSQWGEETGEHWADILRY
jgi:hypothetical protein